MLILLLLIIQLISYIYALPVVLMHGILSNKNTMNELKEYLETTFSLNVIVPEIGNGFINSVNIPLNKQGDMLCEELNNNIQLIKGFNYIGMSQGGILGRYYIETCGIIPINNFITLVSPHGGVYNNILYGINMYNKWVQKHYSFSSHWRDPYNYNKYTDTALLAELNNENISNHTKNLINKERFSKLNNFIMTYSPFDKVLSPPESGKFSTYNINSFDVVPLDKSIIYNNLGLNEMNNTGRLHVYTTTCGHDEHNNKKCFIQLYEMFKRFL